MSKLDLIIDGKEYSNKIEIGENILFNINKNFVSVPQNCLTGFCGSCKCLLLKGKVNKLDEFVLTQKEIDSGFILACCSESVGDDINITFDF